MNSCKLFFLLTCFLLSTLAGAQDVAEVVQHYQAALGKVETIHAQVEQLDTFLSGTVWQHVGEVTLMRNPEDALFGFSFRAAKGVGDEALYDGLSEFQINHEKHTYELTAKPQGHILGSPGGQLIVPEMMNYQDPEVTPELLANDEFYVLHYTYPDLEEHDVRQREKLLFLAKATYLPVKVVERQVSLGKKQVISRNFSEVQVNRPQDQERFRKHFLNDYKMVTTDLDKDIHADLVKTSVKEFSLKTFAGADLSTKPQTGKLLLLDFWEVWCGPCVASMPKVQALADKYGDQGLEVVGVLMDPESQDSAERLIGNKGVTFVQTLGNEELRDYFRVLAIPQYVLIDQDGIIQKVYQGYDKKMERQILKLLANAGK